MRVFERLVASVSVALYLCAAFTPCPTAGAMNSIARIAALRPLTSAPIPTDTTAAHSHPIPNASSDDGAHHGDHVSDVAHASKRTHTESALAWTPTCLCGCSETRAWIGGGAARLGPVIPETEGAHPMPMIATTAAIIAFSLCAAPASIADPIPT